MKTLFSKKGFTLPEILVAVSLFAIVATISSTIYLDIINLEKKSVVQEVFYEDGKIILQQIANLISAGAIDYEEYFNKYVVQKDGSPGFFGMNYGVYSSRFYDPGKSLYDENTKNPANLGVECSYPEKESVDKCEIFYTLSTDLNTGQNPFQNNTSNYLSSNAFCDDPRDPSEKCNGEFTGYVDELFLIDSTGTKKTILGKKKTGSIKDDDYAIGMVELRGLDIDQNGVIDTWTCISEYNCTDVEDQIKYLDLEDKGITLPSFKDLENPFDMNTSQFVPITPKRSSIKSLRFIISPLEDPFKGFNEPLMQAQPSVTVIMTLGLSEEEKANYPGDLQDIMLQGTFTSGVLTKISAYPPTKDVSWINELGLFSTP
ncbi:MAG: type II secretion system protein [Candidatus Gracilibacteria bacterium]|jgi:prepilin-type N-terminal cleavage/methylation domain-containing protein|nr:type II secretion system protein [Candidatus Gracilibacteria bacterium]